MQFGSRIERYVFMDKMLTFAPDVAIAFVFGIFSNKGFIGTFIFALLCLFVLNFMIWAKNAIWSWIIFIWMRREDMRQRILDFLIENKFPEPEDYVESVEAYFVSIADNASLSTNLRMAAASEVGSLNYAKETGKIHEYMRLCSMMEDALAAYKDHINGRLKD